MKEKYIYTLAEVTAFLYMFFADIHSALLAIGFLIGVDTFTGIWLAWLTGAKKEKSWIKGWTYVRSRKAGRIITKLILYPLALIVAKVAQIYLVPVIPWIDVTAGILAMIEIKSIFENIGKLLGYNLWMRIKDALWKIKKDD